jgi:hypothetical protein
MVRQKVMVQAEDGSPIWAEADLDLDTLDPNRPPQEFTGCFVELDGFGGFAIRTGENKLYLFGDREGYHLTMDAPADPTSLSFRAVSDHGPNAGGPDLG